MKTITILSAILVFGFTSCKKENNINTTTTQVQNQSLTVQETEDLLFLIEEEKLARDVYIYAYNLYGAAIFSNISGSEQNHMNSVADLIDYYGLTNPIIGLAEGEFQNPTLQNMYNTLIQKVDSSLIDAYTVGATIEDLDIYDIEHLYSNTSKTNLINVYDKLTCGSTNHMRGFSNQLSSNNVQYVPQYISQQEYNDILNSDHQHCGQ